MERRIAIGCILAALSVSSVAQNRLAPVETKKESLEAYQDQVRLVLRDAWSPDVKARLIVQPSFQPETAIGLRENGKSLELFVIQPTQHIWRYQLLDMMKNGQIQTLGPSGQSQQEAEIKKLEASLPKRVEQIPLNAAKSRSIKKHRT